MLRPAFRLPNCAQAAIFDAMTSRKVFDSAAPSDELDFHKAITRKERSSRYIRTAIDYFKLKQGDAACDQFLNEIGIARESSIFQHVYNDDNWNSYELEVYVYDRLKDRFEDPYRAIWEFGVASGSGELDQRDALFAFKVKVAPMKALLHKVAETTEKFSLISQCDADAIQKNGKLRSTQLHFNYVRLPEGFKHPHWSSIVAGYGILYGLNARKGLKDVAVTITHWPNLPSDLPAWNGKRYSYDRFTRNIIEEGSGKVVANAKDGPFELDGAMFNNAQEAIARLDWRSESLWQRVRRRTIERSRIKREEAIRTATDEVIDKLNLEHQQQLARYEKELSEKMAEIQMLKVQQDGDYFLTSLLTRPLIVDRNSSETVGASFVVRQKKTFKFRNRKAELGGDICVVDNVTLQNRRYTVFVNGDAMGKSMQGAGGALVLGVVFNAYLTRTRFSRHQQRKSPELWLRDGYYELQNVFVTFDGSMFISVVMGLVDEQSGVMYYINAEHPYTALYRKGRASFIEGAIMLRKIGTPDNSERLQIQVFQLEPGDVIIAGSDGRDDLEIGRDADGMRIINEDENEFLLRIEESHSDLEQLVSALEKRGQFTDDLSLLRLSYRAGETAQTTPVDYPHRFREAVEALRTGDMDAGLAILDGLKREFPEHADADADRYRGRVLYKLKRYDDAIACMESYIERFPGDNEMLELLSRAWIKKRSYRRAMDLVERLALRDPQNVNYLVRLADALRLIAESERTGELLELAREHVEAALQIEPGNGPAIQLQKLLAADGARRTLAPTGR